MNRLAPAITNHPLYQDWMKNWVFLDNNGVLTGYAPDIELIATGNLERVGQFLEDFNVASLRWTEEQIND